jgi:hypothetical protein
MKTTLAKPEVAHFNNADHIEFHTLSYKTCHEFGTVIDAPELLAAYDEKVKQEDRIYKWIRRSEFTQKKMEVDQQRDSAYLGILGIVRTCLKHFDPAIRDNALHVYNLLENYGDLTHAGYDAETAGIDSIVVRLNSSAYLPAVRNLGLETWITELARLNDLFKTYVDDTTQEQIDKPDVNSRTARRETDEAMRKITTRVTALADLNGTGNFGAFIEAFNVLVNHYNTLVREHYGRLHAKTDITPANMAPIAVQQYTGKPVYVIPELSLLKEGKTVSLVFSEDFSVAYKNNLEPGTATLIVKGIGKYVGEITTTFNIAANR